MQDLWFYNKTLFKDSTDAFFHVFTKKFLESMKTRLFRDLFLTFTEFSEKELILDSTKREH